MNEEMPITTEKSRLSPSIHRHHRDRTWQILFPIIVGFLLIIAAGVFVILTASGTSTGASVSQWADISSIWLILPVIMFTLFGTMVLAALIFLMAKLLNILPFYTDLVQQYAGLITARINLAMRKMVNPVVSARSVRAGVNGFFKALLGLKRK
jgi:hypothetical protein